MKMMTARKIKKKLKETRARWVGVHRTAMLDRYAGSAAEELAKEMTTKIIVIDQISVDLFGCTADML